MAVRSSCLLGTYRKEDPLHLQDSSAHNRVNLRSAVLALPGMLCWILSTWLDNKRIWLFWSSSLAPVSLCLTASLVVIHCRFATFLICAVEFNSVWCLWFICPLFKSSQAFIHSYPLYPVSRLQLLDGNVVLLSPMYLFDHLELWITIHDYKLDCPICKGRAKTIKVNQQNIHSQYTFSILMTNWSF